MTALVLPELWVPPKVDVREELRRLLAGPMALIGAGRWRTHVSKYLPSVVSTHFTANEASSQTIAKPAGLANGDLLLWTSTVDQGRSYTQPSGFTQLANKNENAMSLVVGYKYITNAAGEPANYTGQWSNSDTTGAMLIRIQNAGVPTQVFTDADPVNSLRSTVTHDTGGQANDLSLAVLFAGRRNFPGDTNARTPPTGYTQLATWPWAYPSFGVAAGRLENGGSPGALVMGNFPSDQSSSDASVLVYVPAV